MSDERDSCRPEIALGVLWSTVWTGLPFIAFEVVFLIVDLKGSET